MHGVDVVDGLRNLALTAGVGVVWIATARAALEGGRLRHAVYTAGALGLVLGLAAETAQLFSPVRTASILDVLTNGLGAFLGAAALANAIAYGARDASRRARRQARHHRAAAWLARLGTLPLLYVAIPYVLTCWAEAFSPLGRPDRVPGAWGGPERRWAVALLYARAHAGDFPAWTDALLFAPAGALLTLWLMERGVRRAAAAALVSGGLAAAWAAAELLRGVAGGDMLGWAVVVHALASAAGAAAAAAWTQAVEHDVAPARGGRLAGERLLAAFAALVVLWSWRPLVPVTSWAEVQAALVPASFIPMARLAEVLNVHSVADVAVGALLYVPLGAWLTARAAARGAAVGGLRTLWPAFAVAVVAEVAQLGIAGRLFDVTDILTAWAGVLVGATVWRAAEARVRTHA